MMLLERLEEIGLSRREAAIYVACLSLGPSSVAQIAEKANEKRTTLYEIIPALIKEGLMHETYISQKRLYVASGPEAIAAYVQKKNTVLQSLLPELSNVTSEIRQKEGLISVLFGVENTQLACAKILESKSSEILSLSANKTIVASLGEDWTARFVARVAQQNIHVRLLTNSEENAIFALPVEKSALRDVRLLPNYLSFSSDIVIFDDCALIVSVEEIPFAILVDNKSIAQALRILFETTWNLSTGI